jgi:hypothetical protein
MSKRVKQAAALFVVIFAAVQLVRPERANPATDVSRTIQAQMRDAGEMVAILDRACGDCHSNKTVWPWYTRRGGRQDARAPLDAAASRNAALGT